MPGNTKGIQFASEDIYSFANVSTSVWSIQGVLKSETSQISSFRSLRNPHADISYWSDEISCLPEEVDIQNYYTHANGITDKTIIKTHNSGENIFSVDFESKNKILNGGMVYQLEVEDQGEKNRKYVVLKERDKERYRHKSTRKIMINTIYGEVTYSRAFDENGHGTVLQKICLESQ